MISFQIKLFFFLWQDTSEVGAAGLILKEEFDRLLSVYLPGLV